MNMLTHSVADAVVLWELQFLRGFSLMNVKSRPKAALTVPVQISRGKELHVCRLIQQATIREQRMSGEPS